MNFAKTLNWKNLALTLLLAAGLLAPQTAAAHCDAMDGPVVVEARQAIAAGDPQSLLKWVMPEHEEQIRRTFAQTMQVRKLSPEAREVADQYFLEALVRLHRESEGASYTGIKPAGTIPGHIARADAALNEGSVDELAAHVANHVKREMLERFQQALAKKEQAGQNAEAGRAFVEAYVHYVHFVEGIVGVISGDHAH
ncbi:DUF6448 family protein [Desulfurivibrio alkaliphilus]|uniref:DUF4142 domain-containing protein n=1 Tax=Desulfurivibrio alkaliphilus (strain DSM 19089 / UNIQEM U267 / AHT2) TaxID=589865 RepID=D6Z5W6_DESAT|nr:DUF6448 family protein [Desulfurivibrio alkaliphilus]ADH84848.1 conserved hypothetical protein [Desulfurivibrio alkaliphilus AHT 2]